MAVALSFVAPVMLAIGAISVTYIDDIKTKTDPQAALCAGTLTGTSLTAEATDQQRIDAAKKAFRANIAADAQLTTGSSDYVVASSGMSSQFSV